MPETPRQQQIRKALRAEETQANLTAAGAIEHRTATIGTPLAQLAGVLKHEYGGSRYVESIAVSSALSKGLRVESAAYNVYSNAVKDRLVRDGDRLFLFGVPIIAVPELPDHVYYVTPKRDVSSVLDKLHVGVDFGSPKNSVQISSAGLNPPFADFINIQRRFYSDVEPVPIDARETPWGLFTKVYGWTS